MKNARTVKQMAVMLAREDSLPSETPSVSYRISSVQGADLTVTVWYDGRVLISNFCRNRLVVHSVFSKSKSKKNIRVEYFQNR